MDLRRAGCVAQAGVRHRQPRMDRRQSFRAARCAEGDERRMVADARDRVVRA